MSDSIDPSAHEGAASELALAPGADYWAARCGWVPGTAYCANRSCAEACVFRAQYRADVEVTARLRRQRRGPGAGVGRR